MNMYRKFLLANNCNSVLPGYALLVMVTLVLLLVLSFNTIASTTHDVKRRSPIQIEFREKNGFEFINSWRRIEAVLSATERDMTEQVEQYVEHQRFDVLQTVIQSDKLLFLTFILHVFTTLCIFLPLVAPAHIHAAIRSQALTVAALLFLLTLRRSFHSAIDYGSLNKTLLTQLRNTVSAGLLKHDGHILAYVCVALLANSPPWCTAPLLIHQIPFYTKYALLILLAEAHVHNSISKSLKTLDLSGSNMRYFARLLPSFVSSLNDVTSTVHQTGSATPITQPVPSPIQIENTLLVVDSIPDALTPDLLEAVCTGLGVAAEVWACGYYTLSSLHRLAAGRVHKVSEIFTTAVVIFLWIQYCAVRVDHLSSSYGVPLSVTSVREATFRASHIVWDFTHVLWKKLSSKSAPGALRRRKSNNKSNNQSSERRKSKRKVSVKKKNVDQSQSKNNDSNTARTSE